MNIVSWEKIHGLLTILDYIQFQLNDIQIPTRQESRTFGRLELPLVNYNRNWIIEKRMQNQVLTFLFGFSGVPEFINMEPLNKFKNAGGSSFRPTWISKWQKNL